jgi:hypothetical protein
VNTQGGGVDISGAVGTVRGDIVGRDKITFSPTIIITSPIGKIIEGETPPGPNTYVDRKHQFSISWPKDSDWIPSSRMGAYQLSELGASSTREMSFLFGLVKIEIQAGFAVFKIQRPHGTCAGYVNIDIFPTTWPRANPSIKVLSAITIKGVWESRGVIISQNVDSQWAAPYSQEGSSRNSATIIYRSNTGGFPIIVKMITGKSCLYMFSSPSYPPNPVYDNVREETNAILNSFTLLY